MTGEQCRQDEEEIYVPYGARTTLARAAEENGHIPGVVLRGDGTSFFLYQVIEHCMKLLVCSKNDSVSCSARRARFLRTSPYVLASAGTYT